MRMVGKKNSQLTYLLLVVRTNFKLCNWRITQWEMSQKGSYNSSHVFTQQSISSVKRNYSQLNFMDENITQKKKNKENRENLCCFSLSLHLGTTKEIYWSDALLCWITSYWSVIFWNDLNVITTNHLFIQIKI